MSAPQHSPQHPPQHPVRHSYGRIDTEYGLRLATTEPDEDGPIWMVNLMKYKQVATYAGDAETAITGQQADDRYAPMDVLADIGAEVVLFGDVDTQLLGDDTVWDRVGVVKYPSRRSFIEMQSRADFAERHVHKAAGMEFTIVMGCVPRATPVPPAVHHPEADADGSVLVMHVIRYHDPATGPELMRGYEEAAAAAVATTGASGPVTPIAGWFNVEGTIVGDGRVWHEVRVNQFASRDAFLAVVADPGRQAAQRAHRERAIADTYAMILRPRINQIAASLQH